MGVMSQALTGSNAGSDETLVGFIWVGSPNYWSWEIYGVHSFRQRQVVRPVMDTDNPREPECAHALLSGH